MNVIHCTYMLQIVMLQIVKSELCYSSKNNNKTYIPLL